MAIVVTKPEIASSPLRTHINELMYSLKKDAVRNREIEALMVARDHEIAEAYEFSYGVGSYEEIGGRCNTDTAFIAIEIIALKDRYKKLIERCEVRHKQFKTLIEQLPTEDREVFLKAFCTQLEVDERDVKMIIRKHMKMIDRYYPEQPTDVIEKLLEGGENS